MRTGDLLRAEQCYTAALQRRPDPATLREAIAVYRQVLASKGATPERAYNLALALFRQGDHQASVQVLTRHPGATADWHALAGSNFRALGDLPQALQNLREAAAREPGNEDRRYDHVLLLLQAGDESKARAELDAALHRFPQSAKLHAVRGMMAYANGRSDEAVQSYSTAVTLEPNAADLRAALGDIYSATGDLHRAATAYAAATRLQPSEAEYHRKEGRNLLKLQRMAEASGAFRRALARDAADPEANYELGKLAAAEKRDAAAARYLEVAVRSGNVRPEAYYQLSQVYRRLGRQQDASAALKRFQVRRDAAEKGTVE